MTACEHDFTGCNVSDEFRECANNEVIPIRTIPAHPYSKMVFSSCLPLSFALPIAKAYLTAHFGPCDPHLDPVGYFGRGAFAVTYYERK